ncbi:hypothetical protein DL96DRAFT_1594203 [Flagelloscypha sp. PMI_526]|nr:hypothetical protein DL96DRAFT_1594203 [Flagelloscypha sp. PMI_526]
MSLTPLLTTSTRTPKTGPSQPPTPTSAKAASKALTDYQLGDSLGKGAFGQVYRALNWSTGETVAVKEIELSNIPKSELGDIMSEIDLLKNLNHPNIVKYKGYAKTPQYLYIILEFCENGSLYAISKRFGKFPETLVAVYISQVLEGLVYLHDQGVIHRDIKGANILTNKDGTVKLADFGVASTAAASVNDGAVVGSPYWMAPEVIEQSGATTASDIWSVGCVVIELLEGKPPYANLSPMPALWRIVQDDCPPLPESASPIVKDFLMHCFQKDCNLRISAKKLLKHPWMISARRQMHAPRPPAATDAPQTPDTRRPSRGPPAPRPVSNYTHDEAVLKVQEWNEALKSPRRPAKHPARAGQNLRQPSRPLSPSPAIITEANVTGLIVPSTSQQRTVIGWKLGMSNSPSAGKLTGGLVDKLNQAQHPPTFLVQAQEKPEEQTDNWDDDFEIADGVNLSISKLQAGDKDNSTITTTTSDENTRTIRPTLPSRGSSSSSDKGKSRDKDLSQAMQHTPEPIKESEKEAEDDEDFTDFVDDFEEKIADFKERSTRRLFHPDDIQTHLKTQQDGKVFSKPLSSSPKQSPRRTPSPLPPPSLSRSSSSNSPHSSPPSGIFNLPGTVGHKRRPSLNVIPTSPLTPTGSMAIRSASGSTTRSSSPGPASALFVNGSGSHSRSSSFAGAFPPGTPTSGSGGRSELRRIASQAEFGKYTEDGEEEDYDDVFFGKAVHGAKDGGHGNGVQTLQLNTRLSNKSWLGDDSDEEDPFAEIDDHLAEDDLETNLQRDKYARLCGTVNGLIDEFTPAAPDFQLREACDSLISILEESPEMLSQLVSSHGMLAILEVLEGKCGRDVILRLLRIVNLLVNADLGFLESFCLIGGIPVMMGFTSKKYPSECRLEASEFIRLLCHTSVLTLQMFISCRGLKVLVDLLDEDYSEQAPLVVHALNGIGSVFELQSPTTKNDFCRMFIREGLLDPLSAALLNVMADRTGASSRSRGTSNASIYEPKANGSLGELAEMKMKIIQILLGSDVHIRNALGTRKLLEPEFLQNANALEILIRILDEQAVGPHSAEMANHIFQTCYNLCRLNKSRQEEAAQAGLIPCLQRIMDTHSPLRQFALPILCDFSQCWKELSALSYILSLVRLQDETARIEDALMKQSALDALLRCFTNAKANSFENLLDPLLKILRLSANVTIAIARSSSFFRRVVDRLSNTSKALVRLNLLRILRTVCEHHPNRAMLVERYGLLDVVEKLSRNDNAILVKELAREIIPILRPGLTPALSSSSNASGVGKPAGVGKLARKERQQILSPSTVLGRPREEGIQPTPTRTAIAPKKSRVRRTASESTFIAPSPTSTMPSRTEFVRADPPTVAGSTSSRNSTARYSVSSSQASRTKTSRARLDDIPWGGTS